MCNAGVPLTCDMARFYCTASQFASVVAMTDNLNIYDVRKVTILPLPFHFTRILSVLSRVSISFLCAFSPTW